MRKPCPVLLMTRSLGLGGSERQLTEIAKALDRAEFEPHVGCFHAEGFRAEELRAAQVPILRLNVPSFVKPAVVTGALALGRYLEEHQIQLVHTFDVPLNLFGVPVARLFRTPRLISSQRAHRALTPGLRRGLLRVTDRLVDAIVVNCEAVRRELVEIDRVPASFIHLCYNGLDARLYESVREPREGPVVVGVICALRPEKGLDTLLEAFARLGQREARLLIVGSGPALDGLQALAAKLDLRDRCVFEPATKHVAERLRDIDVFVLPSLSEAFSNSLMEAMASGCCVVASRVGGNPELVIEEESGLLFRPGDSADLARCLGRLLTDGGLRERLGAAGTRRIREHFSIASAAQRMGAVYRSVLDSLAG
jgi:glycosyltransferase involved in cell wall biosynthesis